ncbi:MAG TPA: DUF2064 domain-containing protein [Mycobacteriales bacterium]|jgi:hypothetical protein
MIETYIVIAKEPVPGRVKTRLTPDVTAADAAELAAAALQDTLDAVDATPARDRVLAFDGYAYDWLRPRWRHCDQAGGGLDMRLSAAFSNAALQPAVLVGMDTPQVTPALLGQFDPATFDACLGPTVDGGYWCIGLRDPSLAPTVINGVPMSTSWTFAAQLDRLRRHGLRVQVLDELIDVDTAADAQIVAQLAPATAFAATWLRLAEEAA